MDSLINIFTPPVVLLLLGVYIFAFGIRRGIEAIYPALSTKTPLSRAQRVWEEVVLPTLPSALGAAFCLAVPKYNYPAGLATTPVSRFLFGLTIGWFSAWGYRVAKFVLQKKWNVPFPDDVSIPPAPLPAKFPSKPPPSDDKAA